MSDLYAHFHNGTPYADDIPCHGITHYVVGRKPVRSDPAIFELPGEWKAFWLDGRHVCREDYVLCGSCGKWYSPWADNIELVAEDDWPDWYRKMVAL